MNRLSLKGLISFKNAHFSYPDQSVAARGGICSTIEPGEKVATLGQIGCGKSTIARLLLGFYTPRVGSVALDGLDIRQIDPGDVHRISAQCYKSFGFSRGQSGTTSPATQSDRKTTTLSKLVVHLELKTSSSSIQMDMIFNWLSMEKGKPLHLPGLSLDTHQSFCWKSRSAKLIFKPKLK
ncbi:ATP-binding cassette domain-containing protein [Ruegeria sp. HKCCA6837]|uniref:ATP-binding cassette domain-containing protein n=1 Tax=Ruegeria sp. HKCCA6837 TaxID=2682989 RepID=UPI001487C874